MRRTSLDCIQTFSEWNALNMSDEILTIKMLRLPMSGVWNWNWHRNKEFVCIFLRCPFAPYSGDRHMLFKWIVIFSLKYQAINDVERDRTDDSPQVDEVFFKCTCVLFVQKVCEKCQTSSNSLGFLHILLRSLSSNQKFSCKALGSTGLLCYRIMLVTWNPGK